MADAPFAVVKKKGARRLMGMWGYDVGGAKALPARAIDLMCGMLQLDPTKRLTMEEVMRHAWFLEEDPG